MALVEFIYLNNLTLALTSSSPDVIELNT
jgi:hypothetical protein